MPEQAQESLEITLAAVLSLHQEAMPDARVEVPKTARFALRPVIGTTAWVPHKAQQARNGGNNRMIVSSSNKRTSPGSHSRLNRRTMAPFSEPGAGLSWHKHNAGVSTAAPVLSSSAATCAE